MINERIIDILFSVIALTLLVFHFSGLITYKVTAPIMFTSLGCQQLYNGLFYYTEDKFNKRLYISVGILSILFSFYLLISTYYSF